MYRITEIKKLLAEHDYLPIVRKKGDGVVFTLPAKKFSLPPREKTIYAYSIRRGGEPGVFYTSTSHTPEKFLPVPEYAARLFVMANIVAHCGMLPIDHQLVRYVDENGSSRDGIEDIVDQPSTAKECVDEGFLAKLIIQAREEGFPPDLEEVAMTHGVHPGYLLIKSFLGTSSK